MKKRICFSLCLMLGVFSEVSLGLVLTGQVVDTQAQPIQGAEVVVCERYSVSCTYQAAKVIAPIAKTDAQGRFVFELDPALSENVSRQRNIFVVARKAPLACAWEWLNGSLNTWARKDLPLVLEPAGELAGQVVDARGNFVKGAEVQVLPLTHSGFPGGINDTWRVTGPKAWFSVTTDAQGRFRFDQLSVNANVCLRVRPPGSQNCYDFLQGACSLLGFSVGQSDIHLRLPGVGTIVGQVRDDRGRPVPDVDLKVCFKTHPVRRSMMYKDRMTCSDAQGFFTFDAIPEGPHWIDVYGHGKDLDPWVGKMITVSVKAGQTARTTVRVTKGGMYEVTARNAVTGHPLEGLEVGVQSEVWARHWTITDARGRARIRALPGSHSMYVGGDRVSLWRTAETLRSGQTVPVEALVDPTPRVTGRVVDAQNRPVAHVLVNVRCGDHVLTDDDGRFSAYRSKHGPAKTIWIMARDRAHGRAVLRHVTDPSRPVTLKLKPARPLIGQVTDPQGRPVCAATVELDSHVSNNTNRMDERVLTDGQGRFTLEAIPPRQPGFDYRLGINAAGYGPPANRRFETRGQAGDTQDIGAFTLIPATESVSGCVVTAKGVPVPEAEVSVHSARGAVPQYSHYSATDEQGRFRLPLLCEGAIKIEASGRSKYPGKGTLMLQTPAENVKIVLGKNLDHDATLSLSGKPLPDLSALSKDLNQIQAPDTPLLVCLCDIQQRPSRQCLFGLSQKVDALSARGLALVVVQVSDVPELHQPWLNNALTDLPIHMCECDFETRRRAWAVSGLPWLILTDKDHVVRADGFALSELDLKIMEIERANPH